MRLERAVLCAELVGFVFFANLQQIAWAQDLSKTTTASASTESAVLPQTSIEEFSCDRVLEDFSKPDKFNLPAAWISHADSDLERARRDKIYQIQSGDDGAFLKAIAHGDGVILHLNVDDWNLKKYPFLRWRWRIHELPVKASEEKSSTNDTGAAVYVIWKSSFVMRVKSIKLTWSSSLNAGTHIAKRLGYDHVHVLKSGLELKDQWVTEFVNLQELAARYYPKEKNPPIAIALLTDADNTKSSASADYAGFELCRSIHVAESGGDGRDPALKK